ncbi:tyrosine-type recombinase/integrase [Phocaeicola sp.]
MVKDNSKEPVKLRSRKRANGSEALYLDIYLGGKRQNEYLKLYLVPEKTREDKARNKETMTLANAIKAKRIVEIQNGRFGFNENKEKRKLLLIDWLESLREYYKNKSSDRFSDTVRNLICHVKKYSGEQTALKDVDKKYIEGLIKFLNSTIGKYGNPLSKETVYTYYVTFSIAMNKAVRKDLIPSNPCNKIDPSDKPERRSKKKEYLTLEEIQKLIDTECADWRVKYSFLFCCFTGLRWIDVSSLRWKNIQKTGDNEYQIELIQQKTKELVCIPLSENAMKWLPEKGINGYENKVFPFGDRSIVYDYLHKWTKAAGINKKIVFHSSRHTYATLLLYYGADLYTVSKLLGHASIKTTQIYAKIVDESKRKAVNLIPDLK